jgi:predicted metal-dependent hydrolase
MTECNAQEIPEIISIFGKKYKVKLNVKTIGEAVEISNNEIFISHVVKGSKEIIFVLTIYLQAFIKVEIEQYAQQIAAKLKVKFNKISVQEYSHCWGSLSEEGNLFFSWRLIFAPKYILEYIVAHQLCHLVRKEHSGKFWNLVDKVYLSNSISAIGWLEKYETSLYKILNLSTSVKAKHKYIEKDVDTIVKYKEIENTCKGEYNFL